YMSDDTPAVYPLQDGDVADIDLAFRGRLLDMRDNTEIAVEEWTVKGNVTVPTTGTPGDPPAGQRKEAASSADAALRHKDDAGRVVRATGDPSPGALTSGGPEGPKPAATLPAPADKPADVPGVGPGQPPGTAPVPAQTACPCKVTSQTASTTLRNTGRTKI